MMTAPGMLMLLASGAAMLPAPSHAAAGGGAAAGPAGTSSPVSIQCTVGTEKSGSGTTANCGQKL